MFSKALSIFALAAAVVALPSRGGLKVSVSAPQSITSIDGLKVVASVTNTGAEDVTIVNYGTLLDNRPTQSFTVTKNGAAVPFTGLKLMLSMEDLDESAYTTIKAGETVSVEHDVASLYDFEGAGVGAFDFKPLVNLPIVVNKVSGGRPELTPYTFVDVPTASTSVSADVARRSLPGTEKAKRATVSCSNSSQASYISAAYSESKSLASIAASYTSANGSSSLFTSYWKTNSPSTIASRFSAVASENTSARTLNCSDPYGVCTGGVIAYTLISGNRPIYFCSIFYNEVSTGNLCTGTSVASRNIRGGTVLHESTHAISSISTTDVGYGCSYDQGLSASNQLNNADNYNCYATQVYASTRC